jgi:hypothetical protein
MDVEERSGIGSEVVRNKSGLVAQGYSQKEGINYEETFAPVARLEAIRILLAFSVAKGFKLHQMDVKSAFLNGVLEEEVHVRQPPGFESEKYPHRVYKLRKALYGLKQAPRSWYGRLRGFLFERGFEMGKVDQTLFLLSQQCFLTFLNIITRFVSRQRHQKYLLTFLNLITRFVSLVTMLEMFIEIP